MSDIKGTQSENITLQAMQETAAEERTELTAEQRTSLDSFKNALEEAINPFSARMQKTRKPISSERIRKMAKMGEQKERLLPIEQLKEHAEGFQQRNPELKANILLLLRERIKPGDTKEEILAKLREFYPDVSLADEALDFLFETTEGELARTVQEAKAELNAQFGREIAAGKNISTQAREAAQKMGTTPTTMRDTYRDIVGNPRDSTTLFQELSQKYAYKELKQVVDFLLHSLGADMKSKGPSIPRGQLYRLLTETRSLQAILGVYRFFRNRMPLVSKLFQKEGMDLPSQMNFESLTKQFMSLAGERYPSSDKILQSAVRLGIEKWIMAKIIAFSQLRDAIREVAVNQIYRSVQHRDELYLAILEALEELEDELEELLEKEEEEEEEDGEEDGKEEEEAQEEGE